MPITTLNISGRKFVVLPEREYRQLKARASGNGKPARAKRSATLQERGDIARGKRSLANARRIPAQEVFRKLGV